MNDNNAIWTATPIISGPELIFKEESGPKSIARTPVECWELFMTFLDEIVYWTNQFIDQIKVSFNIENIFE